MQDEKPSRKNWRTILMLVISALGILFFVGLAFTLGLWWLITAINASAGLTEEVSIGLLIWSSILSGLLLLPAFLLSLYQLRGQDLPAWLDSRRPKFGKWASWVILIWPGVVFLGWFISGRPSSAVFLLGPINLLAAGLPVLWIYHTAQRKLNGGRLVRKWRVFGFSLTVMPVVVMIAEIIAIIGVVILVGLWMGYRISVNPQFQQELIQLFQRFSAAGDDLNVALQLLEPYLLKPGVILLVLAVFAGIMPAIEEILKPMALWALVRRKISPQEGFVGGLLCGAGFALMENVLYFTTVVTAEDWLFMAIGRAGTGILHMLASGMVGWGLAKTWRDGHWGFLGLTSISAILLHGLWNALALVSGILPLFIFGDAVTIWQTLLFYTPLFLLLIISLIGLFVINRYFRKSSERPTDLALSVDTEMLQ